MINLRNKNIKFIAIMAVLLGVFAFEYLFSQGKESEFEKITNETEKQSPLAQQYSNLSHV